jgi:hypothetical protein
VYNIVAADGRTPLWILIKFRRCGRKILSLTLITYMMNH